MVLSHFVRRTLIKTIVQTSDIFNAIVTQIVIFTGSSKKCYEE